MTRRFRLVALLVATIALVAACGDDDDGDDAGATTTGAASEGPAIVIGAQDFGESAILAEIYAQGLAGAGFDASIQEVGGFRDLELAAFDSGDINFAPEYAASMLEFLNENAGEATSDAAETTDQLQTYLDDLDITALEPSDAIDTNSFVVTRDTADELGLSTISDLADHTDLTLGGPSDCETNSFCIPGLKSVYDIDLSANFQALEAGAVGDALDAGAIDIGIIFSTDSRIAERDWVLLEDDMSMLAADNVVPVLTNELVDAYGDDLVDLVNEISAALTTDGLTDLNRRFDVDKEDAADIARSWLEDHDLLD
jgi:osmoprotectant transport system substrate-binding protein